MKKQYYIPTITVPIVILAVVTLTMGTHLNLEPQQIETKPTVVADMLLQPFTVADLSKRSGYLIIGTVESINPDPKTYEFDQLKYAFTDVVINVERDLTGKYVGDQISIRLMGGETDEIRMISDMDAEFAVGERVMVFVNEKEPHTVWGDNYYVSGLKLGKYSLVDGKAVGPETPNGMDEAQFIAKIQKARTAGIQPAQ